MESLNHYKGLVVVRALKALPVGIRKEMGACREQKERESFCHRRRFLRLCPAALWKVELVNGETGHSTEISKQSTEE